METSQPNKAFSSLSTFPSKSKYDVFLSFRGPDTRYKFTSHLLAALERYNIHTFRDDTKLDRGENVSDELPKAIEESTISLVILSEDYAASHWCLDELVQIMECRKTLKHIVLPIFYGVEPSDVRKQQGSLARAFAKHEEEVSGGRVEKWRKALAEVAGVSGWDAPKVANGDEAQLIQKAVDEVCKKLDRRHLPVARHEIGLESRLQNLLWLLNLESNCVCIVAIWGMGGIGKTTISKKLYNHIKHEFEGSCFLANVRETSKQLNGHIRLQEQLLSDILGCETYKLRDCDEGIEAIKRRASGRKVLLILDDVDDVKQLEALAIDQGSFGFGSRIIITTRDMSSLNSIKVDETYEAEELNEDESLKLFSQHCFREDRPTEGYLDLSCQILQYAGGLPLGLEVLGSYLHDKSKGEWKSAISELKNCPDSKIQATLQISFDSLGPKKKELFLDIACFFVGERRDFTVKMLESCQKFAVNGIRDLENRSLVKTSEDDRIVMHDMLQEMGREIVRRESKMPGKRSRLWDIEDAREVLEYGQGTDNVEGLFLNFHELTEVQVDSKALAKMNRLWLLHLDYVQPRGGFELTSRSLMWLCWNGFPLECLPSNLHMESLVTLDLRYSKLKKPWEGTKVMNKLKFLYLSHCYYLIKTPDFSGLNNLEELLLNDCVSLVEVAESIGFLNKLVILDMKNCTKLQKFPSGISMLKSLESLDLSGCSMLGKFSGFTGSPWKSLSSFLLPWIFRTNGVESTGLSPSNVLGLSCLKYLSLKNCNLSCLPNEVGNLILLETLDLSKNNLRTLPDRIGNLTCLKSLTLEDCNLSCLPNEVGNLISLENLDLQRNNDLHTLPDSICDLTSLEDLWLGWCNVSLLPSQIGRLISLQRLDLTQNNLLTLPDSICDLACLGILNLDYGKLSHLPDRIGMLSSLFELRLGWNSNLHCLPNSFSGLANLCFLCLRSCGRLQSLLQLPKNLSFVDADDCTSLKSIPTEFNWLRGIELCLRGCNMLAENNFANALMDRVGQSLKELSGCFLLDRNIAFNLPGDEVPNWFRYQSTGSKISLMVPQEIRRIRGVFLCTVFSVNGRDLNVFDGLDISIRKPIQLTMASRGMPHPRARDQPYIPHTRGQDLLNIRYITTDSGLFSFEISGGDELEIEINPENLPTFTVKKCGINFIYVDHEDIIEQRQMVSTFEYHTSRHFVVC